MWGTGHLTEAAQSWTHTATVWEDCFTQLTTRIGFPGGTAWQGAAADAAFARAHGDRMIVIGLADELHVAARIARTGAGEIAEARRAVLRVVESAENAGFSVGEDFSVTCPGRFDPVTAAARQAQAIAIATELRATVGALVTTDQRVAARRRWRFNWSTTETSKRRQSPNPVPLMTQRQAERRIPSIQGATRAGDSFRVIPEVSMAPPQRSSGCKSSRPRTTPH